MADKRLTGHRLTDNGAVTSPRSIVILGSTGSIGTQAIEVVSASPDRFRVTAISAGGGNVELLARQAVALGAQAVGVAHGERDAVADLQATKAAHAATAETATLETPQVSQEETTADSPTARVRAK